MVVRLHRDRVPLRIDGHPCWRVGKALIDAGIPYEVVREPALPRSRRTRVIAATGRPQLPAIEFADGRWLQEDSAELAARIHSGALFEPPPDCCPERAATRRVLCRAVSLARRSALSGP
jgi:hypothetical protein